MSINRVKEISQRNTGVFLKPKDSCVLQRGRACYKPKEFANSGQTFT